MLLITAHTKAKITTSAFMTQSCYNGVQNRKCY